MDNLYTSLEEKYKLPSGLLSSVEGVESGGYNSAVSPKGARSSFQFMPDTAKAYNVDVNDKVSAAHGAARYLSDLLKEYGSVQAALAHYNGGTKSGKAVAAGQDAPYEETRNYLQKVNSKLKVNPENIQWSDMNEPQGSVTVSSPNPQDIQWNDSAKTDTSNMSNQELFGKGILQSGKTTATGVGQALDLPAQFLEKKLKGTAIGDVISQFGQKLGLPTAEEAAAQRPEEIRKLREENAAITSTPAGAAGNIVGDIGQALVLPGGTILKTAGAGTVLGAAQPVGEGESRVMNAVGGGTAGALGQTAVNAIGRVAQPIVKNLSKQAEKGVQVLKDAGVPLDLAQETGSKVMGWAKRLTSDNPFTGGGSHAFEEMQNNAYTKAIARTMGEDAERITPEVLKNAKTRLGDNYDALFGRNGVRVTRDFQKELTSLKESSEKVMPEGQKGITNIVNDILDKSKVNMGHLDGKQYQAIKQQLAAMEAQGGTAGHYAGELREKLFEGLSNTIKKIGNKDDLELLKQTNKQYGNMKKIEDIALKDPEGHVSASKLYNSLTTKSKRNAFYQDDPELARLASAGKNVLPEKMPNSGTAARLAGQAAIPTAVAMADYAKEGDIGTAAKLGLSAYVAPKLLQKALTSQGAAGKYLREGVQNIPLRSLLQAPSKLGVGKLPLAYETQYLQKGKQ
jgi:hypothetical protein